MRAYFKVTVGLFVFLLVSYQTILAAPVLVRMDDKTAETEISGVVVDGFDSVFGNVRVRLQSKNLELISFTNSNGEFNFKAPNGKYKLTVEIDGFYPLRRSHILVAGDSPKYITLRPVVRITQQFLMGDGSDRYKSDPPPKYFTKLIGSTDLVIMFEAMTRRKGKLEFKDIVFTYNDKTILADSLSFDPKALNFIFTGYVRFENKAQT